VPGRDVGNGVTSSVWTSCMEVNIGRWRSSRVCSGRMKSVLGGEVAVLICCTAVRFSIWPGSPWRSSPYPRDCHLMCHRPVTARLAERPTFDRQGVGCPAWSGAWARRAVLWARPRMLEDWVSVGGVHERLLSAAVCATSEGDREPTEARCPGCATFDL